MKVSESMSLHELGVLMAGRHQSRKVLLEEVETMRGLLCANGFQTTDDIPAVDWNDLVEMSLMPRSA